MSLPFCTSLFSCTLTHSCRSVRLQRGGQQREAVIRDTSGNGHRSVTNLSASIWFTGQRHAYTDRFSSRVAIIAVDSMLEKHFDGDFTPDQERQITFKRWGGVPNLKT